MKFNKVFSFLTACAFVVGMSTFAMAANRIEVKVTSEPIPQKSSCSKAGGFSLEFDEGTVLTAGDQLTMDLDFGVTLCRTIDIMIAPAGDILLDSATGLYSSGTLFTQANTNLEGTAAFTQSNNSAQLAIAATSPGVVFRVYGTKGSQRVTIDVLGPVGNTLTVLDPTTDKDKVTLNILDEKTNAVGPAPVGPATWANDTVWEKGTTANLYSDAADWDDNTICIDVSSDTFTKTVVNGSMDSKNDKYTFIPSNPQIAHIATPVTVNLVECKTTKGNIPIPKDDQAGCVSFDYETGAGYCLAGDANRRVVLSRNGAFSTSESYAVKLEIINPAKVYWSNATVNYTTLATGTCSVAPTGVAAFPAGKVYDSTGDELTSFVGTSNNCDIASAQKAKTIISGSANIFTTVNQTGLYIDMPAFSFESGVSDGEKVEVKVTLVRFPCGELFSGTVEVGTFGCASTSSDNMLYPYYTGLQASEAWWDGFVIDNLTGTAGEAKITVYEADGDQGTLTVTVGAYSQYVKLLSSVLDSFTPASTNTGTLGDSTCYIKVTTDFGADGFAMMGEGMQAQGYLPRK